MDLSDVVDLLQRLTADPVPPSPDELADDLLPAIEILESEPDAIRPHARDGRAGGLVYLDPALPVVVLPDIHARLDLLASVLGVSFPDHGIEEPVGVALAQGTAQLVCIGDYVHGEARVRDRWLHAYNEFVEGYESHRAMDAEMAESLGVVRTVARLKRSAPRHVFLLKGNHENIANEYREGNMPFGKFVAEGEMVAAYMERFYAGDALRAVYRFEKSLALLAVGGRTLISHAEPERLFEEHEVIHGLTDAGVVAGLTWTPNDGAAEGSVQEMLQHYLPETPQAERMYIGGHRPIPGIFNLRAAGRYVQIHNPSRLIAAALPTDRAFDPERDVFELDDAGGRL